MKRKYSNIFVDATPNYKIQSGTYDFLICSQINSSDNRTVSIKCKLLKTALKKIINLLDSNYEFIDYEVAVYGDKSTIFINLYALHDDGINCYLG